MKNFLFVLLMCFSLTACLNSTTKALDTVNANPDSTGSSAAPIISAIKSRAPNSGGSQLYFDLEGDNFGGLGWGAKLERGGQEIPLSIQSISKTNVRLLIDAAATVAGGVIYNLVIANAYGQASASVTTLKGDVGPAGPQGPAGPSGPQGVQGPAGIGTWTTVADFTLAGGGWSHTDTPTNATPQNQQYWYSNSIAPSNMEPDISPYARSGFIVYYFGDFSQSLPPISFSDTTPSCDYRLITSPHSNVLGSITHGEYLNYRGLVFNIRGAFDKELADFENSALEMSSSSITLRVRFSDAYNSYTESQAKTFIQNNTSGILRTSRTIKFTIQKRCVSL